MADIWDRIDALEDEEPSPAMQRLDEIEIDPELQPDSPLRSAARGFQDNILPVLANVVQFVPPGSTGVPSAAPGSAPGNGW